MNKTHKTIENLFSQVRNDVTVPSYGAFYATMQPVTKPAEVRNTLRGWKLIPSIRIWVGITLAVVLMLPVVYSVQTPQVLDPALVLITEEADREIQTIINEDQFINSLLDQYLQQLEMIQG